MTNIILIIIFPSLVLIFILLAKILDEDIDLYLIISIFIMSFLLVFILGQKTEKKETNQTIVNKINQTITKGIKKECNTKKINPKELKKKREEVKKTLFIIVLSIGVAIVTLFLIIGKGDLSAFSAGLAVSVLILFFFNLYSKELVNYYLCKEYGKTFVLKKQTIKEGK